MYSDTFFRICTGTTHRYHGENFRDSLADPTPAPPEDSRYRCESETNTKNIISYLPGLLLQPPAGQVLYASFAPAPHRTLAPNNIKIPGITVSIYTFIYAIYNAHSSYGGPATRGLIVVGTRKFPCRKKIETLPLYAGGQRVGAVRFATEIYSAMLSTIAVNQTPTADAGPISTSISPDRQSDLLADRSDRISRISCAFREPLPFWHFSLSAFLRKPHAIRPARCSAN